MKINWVKRGRLSWRMPLDGVKFSAGEQRSINDMARKLVGAELHDDDLRGLRDALGRYIVLLEAAGEWTEGESDELRQRDLDRAMLHYQAVEWAFLRQDIDGKVRPS